MWLAEVQALGSSSVAVSGALAGVGLEVQEPGHKAVTIEQIHSIYCKQRIQWSLHLACLSYYSVFCFLISCSPEVLLFLFTLQLNHPILLLPNCTSSTLSPWETIAMAAGHIINCCRTVAMTSFPGNQLFHIKMNFSGTVVLTDIFSSLKKTWQAESSHKGGCRIAVAINECEGRKKSVNRWDVGILMLLVKEEL